MLEVGSAQTTGELEVRQFLDTPPSELPEDNALPPDGRVSDHPAQPDFAVAIHELLAERYGGSWIEGDGKAERLVVAITDEQPSDLAAVQAELPQELKDAVEIANAEISVNELYALSNELAAELFELGTGDKTFDYLVDPRFRVGQVVITIEGLDERQDLANWARNRESERVRIIPGSIELGLADTRNTFPPYEGGSKVRNWLPGPGVWNDCTSSFIFLNGYGRFGGTAGHCTNINFRVRVGSYGSDVDHIRMEAYHSAGVPVLADHAMFSLDAGGWSSVSRLHMPNATHRSVKGNLSNPAMDALLLKQFCSQGLATEGSCGGLTFTNLNTCCDDWGKAHRVYCFYRGVPVSGGDSGGPVYRIRSDGHANAAGVNTLWVNVDGNKHSCFSALDYVMWIFGSSLVLG
ncbi:MAG: hypothetical protein ACLGI8_01390 [Acidimicrobiia bacterium]